MASVVSPFLAAGPACAVARRWFTYYAFRIADDDHYGKNLSGLKFDEDGGFYKDALKDLKFIAGNAALQFLRGPLLSGMVKSDCVKSGHFDLSQWDETQKRERIFFGGAIPSVRALNGQPKPEDTITRGGMHGPLDQMAASLGVAFHAARAKHTCAPAPQLSAETLKRKLEHIRPFDPVAARRALHGDRPVALALPKAPRGGWGQVAPEERPWWVRVEEPQAAPPAEPVA